MNIDEILQSPRQFCDLETFITLAEKIRAADKLLAMVKLEGCLQGRASSELINAIAEYEAINGVTNG